MFKSPPAAQSVPSYSRVVTTAEPVFPPIARPAVKIPAPELPLLAVGKFSPAVHVDPLYSAVTADKPGAASPPKPT